MDSKYSGEKFTADDDVFNFMKETDPKGKIMVNVIEQEVGFSPSEFHFFCDVPPRPVIFIDFIEEPVEFMLNLLLGKPG